MHFQGDLYNSTRNHRNISQDMIKDKYLGMDISHYLRKKNFDAQHETL